MDDVRSFEVYPDTLFIFYWTKYTADNSATTLRDEDDVTIAGITGRGSYVPGNIIFVFIHPKTRTRVKIKDE